VRNYQALHDFPSKGNGNGRTLKPLVKRGRQGRVNVKLRILVIVTDRSGDRDRFAAV
jgi:hypothetical protein